MRKRQFSQVCAWSLGILLLSTQVAYSQTRSIPPSQQAPNIQMLLQELAQANVVYLGETHDSLADHDAQLQILKVLHERNPRIAIAMEMFQRPFQRHLDEYLANTITEAQLRERTEYKERWGFPWEYYAPILRFAKANRLPVIALNTPTELTRKVARNGLESLTAQEQKLIPPLSEIRTDNGAYRQMLQGIFQQHQQGGHGRSDGFERFFQAQVLWDETMAETIAEFLQTNADHQVVVLVGQGHIVYGYGIPSRVARRLGNVVQRTVLLNPPEGIPAQSGSAIADFIWNTTSPAN